MGYRIDYDTGTRNYEIKKEVSLGFSGMVMISFSLFLLLTVLLWPEGTEVLREMMIPGDNDVTLQAIETMTENLQAGSSLREAVTAFCQEVIYGAENPD